jgi:hypothetical protein
MGPVLLLTGLCAIAIGTWRGYANARAALAPVIHAGDPTRTAVEATQPVLARGRVRRVARDVAAAIGWLGIAMYGLFLVASAEAVR